MKVSGFTIVRNGELYAYPYVEAIQSILPLCDEMVVNVGKSNDNTLEIIRAIDNKKNKDLRIRMGHVSERRRGFVSGNK